MTSAAALVVSCGSSDSSEEDINAQTSDPDQVLATPSKVATGIERLPKPQLKAGQRYEVELADSVDFIDGHPDIDTLEADGSDGLIIVPKAGKKPALGKGRILLSRNHALAHWVDEVKMVKGKPRFKLRPAKLTEVFHKIDIEADVILSELPAPPAKKPGAISSPITLINESGTEEYTKKFTFQKTFLDTENLDAGAEGELNTSLKLWFKAYYNWKATSADECTFGASVKFESDADFDAWFKAKATYSKSGESSLGSGVQLGWSFGVVSGILDLDLVLNYAIEASGQIDAHLDAGYDNFTFKTGAKYVCGNGWTKIEEYTSPQWHKSHEVTAQGSVTATLYPALEASVLIYGLAGPEIAIGPAFDGKASLSASSSNTAAEACVELDAALRAEVNFVVDAFGLDELVEKNFGTWDIFHWDVFDDCWTYCPNGDPADGTVAEDGYCCVTADCKTGLIAMTCQNNKCKKFTAPSPN